MSPKQALTVPRYTHARLLPRSWGGAKSSEAHL
jgi:hypothetical protein